MGLGPPASTVSVTSIDNTFPSYTPERVPADEVDWTQRKISTDKPRWSGKVPNSPEESTDNGNVVYHSVLISESIHANGETHRVPWWGGRIGKSRERESGAH